MKMKFFFLFIVFFSFLLIYSFDSCKKETTSNSTTAVLDTIIPKLKQVSFAIGNNIYNRGGFLLNLQTPNHYTMVYDCGGYINGGPEKFYEICKIYLPGNIYQASKGIYILQNDTNVLPAKACVQIFRQSGQNLPYTSFISISGQLCITKRRQISYYPPTETSGGGYDTSTVITAVFNDANAISDSIGNIAEKISGNIPTYIPYKPN